MWQRYEIFLTLQNTYQGEGSPCNVKCSISVVSVVCAVRAVRAVSVVRAVNVVSVVRAVSVVSAVSAVSVIVHNNQRLLFG